MTTFWATFGKFGMLFNSASGHSGDAPGQVRAYSVLQLGKVLLGLAVSVPVSAYTAMIAHQIHILGNR